MSVAGPLPHSIVSLLHDPQVTISAVVNTAVEASTTAVKVAANDKSHYRYNTTAGVEDFFGDLWSALLTFAEEDASNHDRIIAFLKAATGLHVGDGWKIRGEKAQWAVLPMFVATAEEEFNELHVPLQTPQRSSPAVFSVLAGNHPTSSQPSKIAYQSRIKFLNIQRFLARVWVEVGLDTSICAHQTVRIALKKGGGTTTPHDGDEDDDVEIADSEDTHVSMDMDSPSKPDMKLDDLDVDSDSDDEEYVPSDDEDTSRNAVEDDDDDDDDESDPSFTPTQIEAAAIWIGIAGEKIYKWKVGKAKWTGLKNVFAGVGVVKGISPELVAVVKEAAEKMASIERFNMTGMMVDPIEV